MRSSAFYQLEKPVQKWVYEQGWHELREIQDAAIEPVMSGKTDVLISASTASGKTEAAFLPASSAICHNKSSVGILYISPLKALINDQYRRLESLADLANISLTPWHGDVSQSKKNKLIKNPSGILLITPESLESLLVRKSGWITKAFSGLSYIVIDEFHAFIGTERGHHMLSLLSRIEHVLKRLNNPIPRIALSATLGDLNSVPTSLRSNQSLPCNIITESMSSSVVQVQVKGYSEPATVELPSSEQIENIQKDTNDAPPSEIQGEQRLYHDVYQFCRGGNHLVFANSRNKVESATAYLTDLCDSNVVPNEFFAHHGSLAKSYREDLEARLQKNHVPTTAVCTMTLELGIDIGKVDSVLQIAPPHAVSSLRQRLGRSGRRGTPSRLRMLIVEDEITKSSHIVSRLRLRLVQSLAMIRLLIGGKWFEPADKSLLHFSTLLHQVLAVLAQWGGVRADQLYELLCQQGVFTNVDVQLFKEMLICMREAKLIKQLESGEIIVDDFGENIVSHYSFYAVFKTPQEFRVVCSGKSIGSIPVDFPIVEGQSIIFAGKRWKVNEIDTDKHVIYVQPAKGGKAPIFGGSGLLIHEKIREQMFHIFCQADYRIQFDNKKIDYIDQHAKSLFQEGIKTFQDNNLAHEAIYQNGKNVYLFTWLGDKAVHTLSTLLIMQGFEVFNYFGVIEIEKTSLADVKAALQQLKSQTLPAPEDLAAVVKSKEIEKYDTFLSDSLLCKSYAAKFFDMPKAKVWLDSLSV